MGKPFFVYLLRCVDDSYYAGHTDELQRRIAEHQAGEGGEYTKTRTPVELVWSAEFTTREEAKAMEARIKGWSRAKKTALINNDWEMISMLASRGAPGRALRDGLRPPQGSRNRGNPGSWGKKVPK